VDDTVSLSEAANLLGVGLPVMRALLKHQRVPGAYEMDDELWLIPRASVFAFAAERDATARAPDGLT
jgi:hypothetical protein